MKMPDTILAAQAAEKAKQARHELRTQARALDDHRDRENNKQYHDSKEGLKLIEGCYKGVARQLEREFKEQAESSKVGRKWYTALVTHFGESVDLYALAEMACFVAMTAARDKATWQMATRGLVGRLRRMKMAVELEAALGDKWESVSQRLSHNPNDHQRERTMRQLVITNNLNEDALPEDEGRAIAFYLLGVVKEATGYIEEHNAPAARSGKNWSKVVTLVFTEKGNEARSEILAGLESTVGRSRPMIICPEDWTGAFDGGNLTKLYPLLSGWPTTRVHDFDANPEIEVLNAVNNQQGARYAVHKRMFTFIQEAYKARDDDIFPDPDVGLPEYEVPPEELQEYFRAKSIGEDYPLTPEQEAELSRITSNNSFRRKKRSEMKTKRDAALATRREARAMSRVDGFYFVHTLDFRRRVYARSAALNPQGMGMDKALLCAYEGCHIGEREEWLLKLHIADLAGANGTKDAQVAWFDANEAHVLASAADPHNPRAWWRWERKGGTLIKRKLKEALPLLARCFDYADYKADPENFICQAIIPRDATCSGQQHWALCLRDEELARRVSLYNSPEKGDLYMDVLDEVITILKAGIAAGDEEAQWLSDVFMPVIEQYGRGFVKRGVMCSNYSQTSGGRVKNLLDDTLDQTDEALLARIGVKQRKDQKARRMVPETPRQTVHRAATAFDKYALGPAIEKMSGRAADGKKVLRSVARVMAKHGMTVEWHTPTGAHVQQVYFEQEEVVRNKFWFGNKSVTPSMNVTDYDRQRVDKHANSICPQVIHGLDAAHAHLIINTWYATGERFLVAVHDSFGTTLDKVDKLDFILRATLVEMYLQNDPLWDFVNAQVERAKGTPAEAELAELLPEIERLLEPGTYDITELFNSEWCFS